jgi:hypothetical protein
LAATRDFILVKDVFFIHVFDTAGMFLFRMPSPPTSLQSLLAFADNQVAILADHAFDVTSSDPSYRARLEISLHEVTEDGMRFIRTLPPLDNFLALRPLPEEGSRSLSFPYARFFGRLLYMASDGTVTFGLLDSPIVCRSTLDAEVLWKRDLAIPALRVNKEEQLAIIAMSHLPRGGVRLRGKSVSTEDFYYGAWPPRVPAYVDVTGSATGWVAATRLGSHGTRVVDFLDRTGRPLGSLPLLDGVVPLIAVGRCLLVSIETDAGQQVRRDCFPP